MGRRVVWFVAALCSIGLVTAAAAYPLQVPIYPLQLEVDGKLEFLQVERVEDTNPRQDPEGKLRLRVGTDLVSNLRLQTDLTGTAGGTPRHSPRAGVFDYQAVKQDLSPSLGVDEAYLDLYSKHLDVRAGLQRFAWGKLDGIQPNDLLNPESFYDPLLEEENDRKVGVPALSPTVYFPDLGGAFTPQDLHLTAVWVPIAVPYHFPDQDERWYPPLARVPAESEAMGFTVRNRSRFENRDLPRRSLDNGAFAGRFSGLWGGADFAFYYFEGTDPAPALDVSARGFVRLNPLNPQLFDVRSEVSVFPVFHRIRAAGADVATNVLGATLRAEGAYVMGRAYPRSIRDVVARPRSIGSLDLVLLATGAEQEVPVDLEPVNVRRDAVEWGAGGDYLWNDTFILLQVNQTTLLDNAVDLLLSDYETRIALTVRRSFWDDRLKAEVIGLYGPQSVVGLAHPRLTWTVNDHVDVRIGYLLIEGHEQSIIGQYKHNDEGYVRLRLLF